ncbi:MAG: helix-turn-helix domain-containing protein [Burkholderiales bacterium]|nr:helix-turn-helix domain-containing protein [Burkholderiales bacterium]
MLLAPDHCYQALTARDPRFDGRFFVGVSSTGIYCRPVCTVRVPKRQNCTFYPSAAAAELAGYRPCLRCRPELAPGNAAIDASARLAQQAASLIEDGLLAEVSVEALAARLGVTGRHVRRVFAAEFGVSPVQFAQTQRLLLAKRLLHDSALPATEVALASGFGSVRRFNALFKQRYRLTPGALRRAPVTPSRGDALGFELAYRPPLDWDGVCGFLGARAIEGVEAIERGAYVRSIAVGSGATSCRGWLAVAPAAGRPALRVALSPSLARGVSVLLARVKKVFDLALDPQAIAVALGPLARGRPGLRLPGAFDGFEVAVRAVLGQQITVEAARTLAGRFVAAFGEPVDTPFAGIRYLFPGAQRIAGLTPPEIARHGVIAARARSIIALARSVAAGELTLSPGAPVNDTLARLRAVPGVGDWTAQYIAMRALSWPDAFPASDHGVLKALKEKNPRRALARAEGWRPWRAYAVIHLWKSLEGT